MHPVCVYVGLLTAPFFVLSPSFSPSTWEGGVMHFLSHSGQDTLPASLSGCCLCLQVYREPSYLLLFFILVCNCFLSLLLTSTNLQLTPGRADEGTSCSRILFCIYIYYINVYIDTCSYIYIYLLTGVWMSVPR